MASISGQGEHVALRKRAISLDHQVVCQSRIMSLKPKSLPPRTPRRGTESAADAAIAACRRLHAAVDRLDQAAADSLEITRNDLRCLNLLEHGPRSPVRIAGELGLTSGSVTALVDRLEARGYVTRSRDATDRRGVLVSLQPIVFETVGRLYMGFAEELRTLVGRLGPTDGAALARHMAAAAEACEAAIQRAGPTDQLASASPDQVRPPPLQKRQSATD
jgi:DNA-binding MarR family transcriptional regulator